MNTLSSKIVVYNIILIAISTITISLFNLYHNRETLLEAKYLETENQVRIFSSSIQSKIDELRNDTLFLSSTPPVEGILRAKKNRGQDEQGSSSYEQWRDRLEVIFKEMLIAKKHYLQIRYVGVSDKGREILRVDRKGSRIYRVKDINLQQKSHRNYFKEALDVGPQNVYLSEFSLNKERGKVSRPYQMVLRAAVPIYETHQKPFGFIIINMDYTKLFKQLSDKDLNFEKYFITDSSERILLHSNASLKNINKSGEFLFLKDHRPKISGLLRQNHTLNFIKSFELENNLIVFTQLNYDELSPEHHINLITESDLEPINAKVFSMLKNDIFFLTSLVFLSIGLTFVYIGKLVSPLRKLKEIADNVAHEKPIDLDPTTIKSSDEIGTLSRSLITMSKQLLDKNFILEFQKKALDKSSIVVETDPKGKITYVNDKFCEISGYSKEELLGQDHRMLNSGEHPKAFFKKLWDTITSGNTWTGEIKNKAKSGREYWVQSTIVPFLNEQGKIQKFVAIRNDITYQKEQEKNLQSVAQAKSDFLATMSHEIRTPLNAIIGLPDLLIDENLSSSGKEYLSILQSSAQSLKVLIDDILDYSKIEAGKLDIETRAFSLKSLIDETVNMFKMLASEKGIELRVNLSSDFPNLIKSDVTRVRQILTNLVSNAIKFTHKGYVEISGELVSKSNNLYTIQLSVKDTGIGIPDDVKPQLFQSFQQADSSTTRKFGGTGLGLAICKGISKALGGQIHVESQKGHGSTFYFSFDCELSATEESPHIPKKVSSFEARNILIVDDNKTNLLILSRFLAKLNQNVTKASSGKEALETLSKHSFDIVYMDCQMPELDGFETVSLIRKSFSFSGEQPWIIACTASESEEHRKKCLNSGMDDFIAKPITLGNVQITLENYLKVNKTQKAA